MFRFSCNLRSSVRDKSTCIFITQYCKIRLKFSLQSCFGRLWASSWEMESSFMQPEIPLLCSVLFWLCQDFSLSWFESQRGLSTTLYIETLYRMAFHSRQQQEKMCFPKKYMTGKDLQLIIAAEEGCGLGVCFSRWLCSPLELWRHPKGWCQPEPIQEPPRGTEKRGAWTRAAATLARAAVSALTSGCLRRFSSCGRRVGLWRDRPIKETHWQQNWKPFPR